MTNTIKTPTDAEIDDAYRATFSASPNRAREAPQSVPPLVRDFARAVFARWGAAPVGEPVARVYTMEALVPGGSVKCHVELLKPLPAGTLLYTASQPEAAPREPLTVAEVEQILAQWVYEIHGDRARYIVRKTEEAHHIKHKEGGQDE